MEIINKIVCFFKYCKLCKHRNLNESEDPCHECLQSPVNTYSRKPLYFEEGPKDETIRKKKKTEGKV